MKKIILSCLLTSLLYSCEEKKWVLDSYSTMRAEQVQLPATASSHDLLTVEFISANQGFVGGTAGALYATNDGGLSWQDFSSTALGTVRKLVFSSAANGWAATSTGLYSTSTGGKSWQRVENGALNDVQFVTPQIGYAVGDGTQILKTTNGGRNWFSQRQYFWHNISLRAVSFSAPDSGMAVGNYEAEYTTTDGGNSWQRYDNNFESRGYNAVLKFRRPNHFLLMGLSSSGGPLQYSSFLERNPAGDNSPETQNTFTMYGVARFQDRIVAVGENTIIRYDPVYSNNEYTPWALVHGADGATIMKSFRAVDFATADVLYATGPAGLLMRLHY